MGKEASSRYIQDNRDYLHVLFLLPQDFRALDCAGRDSSLLVKVLLSLGLSSTTTAVGGKATRKKLLRLFRKSALHSGWPSHPYVGRYHTVIQDLLFTTSRLHELNFSISARLLEVLEDLPRPQRPLGTIQTACRTHGLEPCKTSTLTLQERAEQVLHVPINT